MGEGEVCVAVITDGNMEIDSSSITELKRDHQCLVEDTEPDPFPCKKLAKEASTEDISSEVSNPVISPTENVSSLQDTASQSTELASSNQLGCGESTSTNLENLSSEETLSDGERSGNTGLVSGAVSTSCVVLEIPNNSNTTGIRKITFKFSKTKQDNNDRLSTSGAQAEPSGAGKGLSSTVEEPWQDYMNAETYISPYGRGLSESGKIYPCAPNMEMKMSKKVVPDSYLTNVKKLLSTGILDGARVKYISSTQERELHGTIGGGGYLCGCSSCNFSKVLNAYEFEQHAGTKTRHPNNHIYLENGKPIYSIIQELKTAPLSILDEVIKHVAGSSINENSFKVWKASLQQINGLVEADENYKKKPSSLPYSLASCPSQASEENIDHASYSFALGNPVKQPTYVKATQERKHAVKKPSSCISGSIMQQKRTAEGGFKRRDNDLHRLLFMRNGLADGTKLAYCVKGQRYLEGYKQGNGLVCGCCDREISPSQFEAHAGMAARRQPYRNIYTSDGKTLHELAISFATRQSRTLGDSKQSLTPGNSNDTCAKCGKGTPLTLCDGSPQASHAESVPEAALHCHKCKEKFIPGRETATGESSSIAKPIVIRLTRVVKTPEFEIGGCVVCRAQDFTSAPEFDDRTVLLCDQCEKEFHVGCLRDIGLCDLKELPQDKWFCCGDCNRIHVALENLVFMGAEIIPASLSNTVNRKHWEKGLSIDAANDVQWRILSGKGRHPEHLFFLSRAAVIFRECFNPIVANSGRDLIPVMVYGRNISGQDFGGIYCIVIIVKSVVVSAGLLRIFGQQVAELPLVATSREHQGKGYFQALFSCIERLLYSMNVEKLVLPAAEEAESIWTKKLGFRKMSEEQLVKYMREFQLTIFKGTSMLEKKLEGITE